MKKKKKPNSLTDRALIWFVLLCLSVALFCFCMLSKDVLWRSFETTFVKLKEMKPVAAEPSRPVTDQDLPRLVMTNALHQFEKKHGVYPGSADELTRGYPNNVLSFIPNGVEYKQTKDGYELKVQEKGDPLPGEELSLAFYPDSAQLAVKEGNQVLALYPVAYGNQLPPAKGEVQKRIVKPNGGTGALGTRGLELQDGFAIHGTNQADSIGKKVTKGCLRMNRDDIETLYPYIAIGTPFEVAAGLPDSPTFPKGLPKLSGIEKYEHEQTKEHMAWKQ